MTITLEELPWYPLEPDDRAAVSSPRKCRRHQWVAMVFGEPGSAMAEVNQLIGPTHYRCSRCGQVRDDSASRRGRNNRKRGNAIELDVARRLGLDRVGQYGTEVDARGEWLIAQVKSGAAFPERIWRWLNAMSATAAQTRAVVLTDAPGPGHKRRALVVVTLEDWEALHS